MFNHHLFLCAVLLLQAGNCVEISSSANRESSDRAPIFREVDEQDTQASNYGSTGASERLMKEFRNLRKSDSCKQGLVDVELVDDNLYEWNVKLFFPDPESNLHHDLKELKEWGKGEDHMMLRVSFKDDFPSSPPFVRIVYPVIVNQNDKIIFKGGAICAEILSRQGWRSDYTMEGVFVVLSSLIVHFDQRASLDQPQVSRYTEARARQNYEYIEKLHAKGGWLDI